MKYIIYGEYKVPAPASVTTVEGARTLGGVLIPGLGDAHGSIDDAGNFVFEKKAGTKGL